MEKQDAAASINTTSVSSLKSYKFSNAKEIVTKFNNSDDLSDKSYLKTIMTTALSIFSAQPIKTSELVETLLPFALAEDTDIYPAIINLMASEVNKVEILVNNYTLEALTRAVWMNENLSLTIDSLDRLFDIALKKIDLNITNLTLFGNLFDAMVGKKITGISKEK